MNCYNNVFFIVFIALHLLLTTYSIKADYQKNIIKKSEVWTEQYISTASLEETETIIDLLLLSYQIVKASCNMIVAKFTIQQEAFKIYTPSFIDSWHDNLQINQNDTTKLESALFTIKDAQKNIKNIYENFRKLLPKIVKINPQPTQTLILDLKNLLVDWGKHQESIPNELLSVQQEFKQAIATISDIKNFFTAVSQSPNLNHTYLKEAAGFFSKTYTDIDGVIKHLTNLRIQNIFKLEDFFKNFFESYYSSIYNTLTDQQRQQSTILATNDQKLPLPSAFFA